MSKEAKTCSLCRYVRALPWRKTADYFCTCEHSPHYSETFGIKGDCGGCEYYEKGRYDSMSLDEALRIITGYTGKISNTAFDYALRDDDQSMVVFWFKSNKDLEDWRDAQIRLFEEVMRCAKENGEFGEEK